MTNFSLSLSFSGNNWNQNWNNSGNMNQMPFSGGGNQLGQMMQSYGKIFAGMDLLDNGAMDGSILRTLTGIGDPFQNQNGFGNYPQQGGFGNYPQQGGFPMSSQPQQQMARPIMPGQNPMNTMMTQFMAMLFSMFDMFDDGQINGSVFQRMFGGNQGGGTPFGGGFGGGSPFGGGGFGGGSPFGGGYGSGFPGSGGSRAFAGSSPFGSYAGAQAGNARAYAGTGQYSYGPGADYSGVGDASAGQYGNVRLSQDQLSNARTIAEVGQQMGASRRDISIAIATAMQESQLKNLNYGDRDSLGLFQQRPSQGWGSRSQVTNPRYAASKFYEGLFKVKNRNSMSLTQAAQKVQRSGFPDAYQKWEGMANSVTNQLLT